MQVKSGDVIEETAELVNPEDRTHVAISLPLAAGFEPLNPNLATAPAEAQPSIAPTLPPTWISFGDDRVFYAYDSLPKGNYRFAFRTARADGGHLYAAAGDVETMYQEGPSRRERGAAAWIDCAMIARMRKRLCAWHHCCGSASQRSSQAPLWLSHDALSRAELVAPRANADRL